MKLIIYTDGASRGNPGHASYGFIISGEKGKLIYEEGKYIGRATNNVAEYKAVLEALKYVLNITRPAFGGKYKVSSIEFFVDSKLVAEQLSGKWKIKSAGLKPFFYEIKALEMELGNVFYKHVPREQNTLADKLANLALDSRG